MTTYLCEADDYLCGQPATTEFLTRDEDGDVYYTYRCDIHPFENPNYFPRPVEVLQLQNGWDEPLTWQTAALEAKRG